MDNPIIAQLEVTLHDNINVSPKSIGNLKILYKGKRELIIDVLLTAMHSDTEFAQLLQSAVHEYDINNQ